MIKKINLMICISSLIGFINAHSDMPHGDDENSGYLVWHGAFMTAAFMVLLPAGVFVGRYMKASNYWFPLHIFFQLSAAIFAIVGWAIALNGSGWMFDGIHTIAGFFTIIILLLSILLGSLSHRFYKPDRKRTPYFPDTLHWYVGRLTLFAGIACVILGLDLYGANPGTMVVIGILVAFFGLACIVVETYHYYIEKIDGWELVDMKKQRIDGGKCACGSSPINTKEGQDQQLVVGGSCHSSTTITPEVEMNSISSSNNTISNN